MRVRPGGVELLRAAQAVIDAAITPHLAYARRDVLHAIERAMALAEDRLTRDVVASAADLAALEDARAAMRGEVLEALPMERRYDARLAAKAIAVATQELANGNMPERREYERLSELLGAPAPPNASLPEIRRALPSLNERLCSRIRWGEADVGSPSYAATLEHLEATTHEALSESGPPYARRRSPAVPPGSDATASTALPVTPVVAALAAWSDVPGAFSRAFPIGRAPAPMGERIDAWLQFPGVACEALCASGNAALATQADVLGWIAERLAANPRVPMVAVESAHQAHDIMAALAEASAAFVRIALAPFRRVRPPRAEATRWP